MCQLIEIHVDITRRGRPLGSQ